ncbi:ABC transporter ATP-binding protein [Shimia marina]|uniref:Iron(3+)-hydroxamate import ATP-binding protein FhuC n=1 Tax=Shimia marina TaxID=321267 RepID=A0A0P1FBH8_9RHOB|nr:ABC transporter ATP-binding protein [Shimia marina]CUH52752.1 Iron(3+)-hydroxamate import ATP-binding protein FhuC [Shimia marina]SFD87140.1 iron complex transport system ATP-binding protein [Shimia marina]
MLFLHVEGLECFAPNGNAMLRDVCFDLPQGAVLAIAGPNGAGKTTLLNLLSGMADITHGDVRVEGQSLRSLSALNRARKIATVSQQSEPDGRLMLRDYVALGQMPIWGDFSNAEHTEALASILDLTGIHHLANKPMGRLSGGEKQRAHIARALVQRPKLLFLDEPTNHLDPDAKGRMLSLVAGLGITVVTILHDLVMIPEFATHVALIKDSRLTDFGTVEKVLTPAAVRQTFGVDYLLLPHEGRQIPALDIRKTEITR